MDKIKSFIIIFADNFSMHGVGYLVNFRLHLLERLLWLMCICVGLFGAYSLAQRTWHRYQTSPMVITMDRNKFSWNTSFPTVTICVHEMLDMNKVNDYISSHPDQLSTEQEKQNFVMFLRILVNVTYETFEQLSPYKTLNISSSDYLDLIWNLTMKFNPEINSGTNKLYILDTITEMGICYAINSKNAEYNSYSYWKSNRWDLVNTNDIVKIHPLDGEIYAQMVNLSTSYTVHFHGAQEVPDIAKQQYRFGDTEFTTVELMALEIFTSKNAIGLTPYQRQCRFPHEADVLTRSPVYSYHQCRTECRIQISLAICNCIPHFYRNEDKFGNIYPVCNVTGLLCLAKIKDKLILLNSDSEDIDCHCLGNCDNSNFFVQSYKSRYWFLGANFQWGISSYPKMQLKRDVIFGFTDLLVYVGGMGGFFLGCSFLTFTELLYFLTWRLFKHLIH